MKPGFEGGQLPLTQRIPKLRGFANPFRVEYNVVNLDDLESLEESEITPDSLRAAGLVHHKGLVKVLGARASSPARSQVAAHAFSSSAACRDRGGRRERHRRGDAVRRPPPPVQGQRTRQPLGLADAAGARRNR